MKKVLLALLLSISAFACSTDYTVVLRAFSGNEVVELRSGFLGRSVVVSRKRAADGVVAFYGLCADTYFLAIGGGDSVSVTEPDYLQDNASYQSTIVRQTGRGNVSTRSRSSL